VTENNFNFAVDLFYCMLYYMEHAAS